MKFFPLNYKSIDKTAEIFRRMPYRINDYSVGTKLIWKNTYHTQYAIFADCLILKNKVGKETSFNYPIPIKSSADIDAALSEIERYANENFLPLIFTEIPKACLASLLSRYDNAVYSSDVSNEDYLYHASDLAHFSGKHYSGQRNHIKKFDSLYPEAEFIKLSVADREKILEFFDHFEYAASKGESAEREMRYCKEFFANDFSHFCVGGMQIGGKLISVSVGEICFDTMINHIEKAMTEYEGVYPKTVCEFANAFCSSCAYINREEDMGDMGLRRSKMQYRPVQKLKKYRVCPQNELSRFDKIPTIHTERLTLDEISKDDALVYFKLSTDIDRNKFWGYDYRDDVKAPKTDYFVLDAKKDFENKTAINFAIRHSGRMIGEIIIYDFDYHQTAEIGIRLSRRCEGHGYAKESLDAAEKFALCEMGLSSIRARCAFENEKSRRLLSSLMTPCGERDGYYLFERKI
ncbi:MAG: GNAT family N-acetyltransferase [Clostridia bacterium]|nr:GNAT family N-acetyltransferase [Clostridia bacterium]